MKFNQLVDDAAEKIEVAQAVNFVDLARLAQLRCQFVALITSSHFVALIVEILFIDFIKIFKRLPDRNLWIAMVHIKRSSHRMDSV